MTYWFSLWTYCDIELKTWKLQKLIHLNVFVMIFPFLIMTRSCILLLFLPNVDINSITFLIRNNYVSSQFSDVSPSIEERSLKKKNKTCKNSKCPTQKKYTLSYTIDRSITWLISKEKTYILSQHFNQLLYFLLRFKKNRWKRQESLKKRSGTP